MNWEPAEFGLKPYEIEVLKSACEIAGVYDELGMLWREDVLGNPGNALAKEKGMTDRYTVIVGGGDESYHQVPWSEQYPEQIRAISGRWRQLATQLRFYNDEPEVQALSHYFRSYADAIEEKPRKEVFSTKDVAEMWLDVDRSWMDVKGRLQIIATREYGYYDPNRIRIFPDFRLILEDERPELEEELAAMRERMLEVTANRYSDKQVYRQTVHALEHAHAYFGSNVVYSGSLDLHFSGQSLPNEQEILDELGSKIMLHPDITADKWQLAIGLAGQVFADPEDLTFFHAVVPDIDLTIRYIGGHEYAEPLVQPSSVHESFGEKITSLLNEDLANLFATATIDHRITIGELDTDDAVRHTTALLGTYLGRIDTGRGASHLQPYYIGHGLQGLRRMISTKFIVQDSESRWHINKGKVWDWLEANNEDLDKMVQICESGDKQAAEEYLAQAQETDQIKDIIKKVNPEATFDE